MKILIIRIGRLGDMLMVLPAIRQLELLYPNAEFNFVTSEDGKRLFKLLGYKTIQIYRRHAIKRLIDSITIKHHIKTQQFDKIYCFETKPKYHRWLPSSSHCLQTQPHVEHFAWRCQQLVDANCSPLKSNYLSPSNVNSPVHPELAKQLALAKVDDDTLLIGLHPSFSGLSRHHAQTIHRLWSPQNFALLAKALQQFANTQGLKIKILIDLLPEERQLGEQIVNLSGNIIQLLTPEPNFARYVSYIQRLNLLITPNTGVMHLAAAANTPLVALFSQFDPRDCGPYMPADRHITLKAEQFTQTPQKGLNAIDVKSVFNACKKLLPSIQSS